MASLAEEIARLTDPAPVSYDPEDIDDVTRAKVPSKTAADDVDDGVTTTSTNIRRRAAALLVDEDSRYAGKKVSRKKLVEQGALSNVIIEDDSIHGESEEEEEEEGGSESEDEDQEDSEDEEEEEDALADFKNKLMVKSKETSPAKSAAFSFEDDGDYSKFADDSGDQTSEEDEDGSDMDDSASDGEEDDSEEDEEDVEEGGIRKFTKTKVDEEVKKGEATKTQLTLWDHLLKARIELQKVLLLVNQLPQPDTWHLFIRAGGDDYSATLAEGQAAVKSLLDKMFYLQLRLSLQHPDTKNTDDSGKKPSTPVKKATADDIDEEITSDDDAEEEQQEVNTAAIRNRKRKYHLEEYPELLAKRHKTFSTYRNDTIQKWFDKTRVATGKLSKGFSAFEQSALKQIRQILSDRDRLVKRTQLKRSPYRILGKPEHHDDVTAGEEGTENNDDVPKSETHDRLKEYDTEIFDDDDFYHQLLRELIERKSMNTNDPVALSRQWLELQKLRSKVKRKVDTRASKGRKIRYDILPKLVNFMAPNDTSSWTNEARDELYSSLFGKRNPELQANAS